MAPANRSKAETALYLPRPPCCVSIHNSLNQIDRRTGLPLRAPVFECLHYENIITGTHPLFAPHTAPCRLLEPLPSNRKRPAADLETESDDEYAPRHNTEKGWWKGTAVDAASLERVFQAAKGDYMRFLEQILAFGRAMGATILGGATIWSGAARLARPLKRFKVGEQRRGWISAEEREPSFVAARAVLDILEHVGATVTQCPSDYDFALETLVDNWYREGGRPFLAGTDAQKASALFVDAIQTTTTLIGQLYSHRFLDELRDRHPSPTNSLEYGTTPTDVGELTSARVFLRSRYLQPTCRHVLHDSSISFPSREIERIADDLDAMLNARAIPSATKLITAYPTFEWVGNAKKWVRSWTGRRHRPGRDGHPSATPSFRPPPGQQAATPRLTTNLTNSPSSKNTQQKLSTSATGDVESFFRNFPTTSPRHLATALHTKQKQTARKPTPKKRLASARMQKRVTPMSPTSSTRGHRSVHSPPSLAEASSTQPSSTSPCPPSPTARIQPLRLNESRYTPAFPQCDSGDEGYIPGIEEPDLEISDAFALKLQLHDDTVNAKQASERKRRQLEAEEKARRAAEEKKRREEQARRAEEERLRKAGLLRKPRQPLVAPLDDDWTSRTDAIMSRHATDKEVLATAPGRLKLAAKDFHTLLPPTEWLNDEIINSSLAHLDDYVNAKAGIKNVKTQTRKMAVFNSFFQERMVKNPAGTRSQLTRMGITKDNFLSIETMLIPVCHSSHWTLLYIRPTKRTVAHIDSLSRSGNPAFKKQAMAWIEAILQDNWVADEWKAVKCPSPLQPNAYDCGVHVVTNGICVALGLNPDMSYVSQDMALQRHRIGAMLLNGGFKDGFNLDHL